MAEADVSIDRTYTVGTRDVFLSLLIGEGQFGTSDVLLDDKQLVRASGPIKLLVGRGPDVDGSTLLVRSIVNDVSTQTNRMSITYRFTGGKSSEEFIARGRSDDEGGLLIFEATFTFKRGSSA